MEALVDVKEIWARLEAFGAERGQAKIETCRLSGETARAREEKKVSARLRIRGERIVVGC
jgi:head-tail adaptor